MPTISKPAKPASGPFVIKPIAHAVAGLLVGSLLASTAYAAETKAKQAQEAAADNQNNATTTAKPANKQANAEASEASLGSVVVTANKREESVQEVSSAISVLDGKELQDKGIGRSASEVLNYVPNASANTQQNGRPRWWIRGVGAGQQQIDFPSPVGVYLDDVYISNATATGFPIFDLDRVEVLRGPQGTLWGKNTTGGAVNIISKKPTFNSGENYVKADLGSYNDRVVQGAVGGEIVSERVAGRLSFYDQDRDGYFRNLFNGRNSGSIKDSAIRGQLLFQLTPDLEALLNVHYRDYDTDGAFTTVTGVGPGGSFRNGYVPSRNRKHVNSNADSYSDSSQTGGSLTFKWQLGKLQLTSISAYEDWKQKSLTDSDNTPLEISRGYTDADSKQYSQEFRLASPREDRWNWLTGLHIFKEDIDSFTATARLPNGSVPQLAGSTAPNSYSDSGFKHQTNSFAIFGSTTYNFTEKFDATLGARWSTEKKELDIDRRSQTGGITAASWGNLGSWWNSYNGVFSNPVGLTTNFDTSLEKRWDAFTYDFTPQYKISETSRTYFKYAHGIKSGGFNTAATATIALDDVKPETLDAYEVGYKSEWLEGTLNFNASLFYYDYKDVQVNVVGQPAGATTTVSYLQNADKASVKGAEIEVEALPIHNLRLVANLGLQSSEFEKFDVVNNGPNYDGNDLVRTPNLNSLISANYRIPLDNGNKIVTSIDWRYTSDQFYFVNAQNAAQNPYYKLLGEDGYSLVNARITYSTAKDRVAVTGYVNNLFDKEYRAHALPAGGATGASTMYGAPRTAGVALTLRF
jgi:iron complex outermembrane receptor protein